MSELPGNLRVHELRTLEAMLSARAPWNDLVDRVTGATPFQTWEWISGFARYDRCKPRVLVIEQPDGRWVGVLPLCERPSMLPGIRRLELIGGRLSDFPGLLAEPAHVAVCEQQLSQKLARLSGCATALIRSQYEPPRWLPSLPRRIVAAEESVVVPLASDVPQFMQSLSAKYRSNLRRYQRRLGAAAVEFHTPVDAQELRAAMPVLFKLHQWRKNSQGERGRFYDARWCEAITDIMVSLQARSITRLTVMRIDGVPAAASLDLRLHGTQYTYQYGMNPQLRALSPGKLLTLRMMEEAIGAGMHCYNFGRGLEEYKLQWSKERHTVSDLLVARSPIFLRLQSLTQNAQQRLLRSRLLKRLYLAARGTAQAAPADADAAEADG